MVMPHFKPQNQNIAQISPNICELAAKTLDRLLTHLAKKMSYRDYFTFSKKNATPPTFVFKK